MDHRSPAARLASIRPHLFGIAFAACCAGAIAQTAARPLYLDPSKPIGERGSDLVGRLTLEEKAEVLNHTNTGIPRLSLPLWGGWNQTLHGAWSKEPTTLLPAPIAMGATWDPALVHAIADAMSDEGRALYNSGAEGAGTSAHRSMPNVLYCPSSEGTPIGTFQSCARLRPAAFAAYRA